jgi:hypothetical protein
MEYTKRLYFVYAAAQRDRDCVLHLHPSSRWLGASGNAVSEKRFNDCLHDVENVPVVKGCCFGCTMYSSSLVQNSGLSR